MRFSLRFTFSFPKISAPHAALPYDNTTMPERQEVCSEKASFVQLFQNADKQKQEFCPLKGNKCSAIGTAIDFLVISDIVI